MNILVTGCDGYIGSVLVGRLLDLGKHTVVGVDAGFYRQGLLYSVPNTKERASPAVYTKDIRDLTPDDIADCDAIVHLAELSNDPLGQNDPEITFAINHRGTLHLAEMAKQAGVRRFIYTSSCSVYGAGGEADRTETSEVNPLTAYAECKVLVERDLKDLASNSFSPVFLRNATVYGPSQRMRFDIVLNNLCGVAYTTGRIAMTSDGTPWRPIVHVDDVCEAIMRCLDADASLVHNEIFNVGSNEQNYRIREIAEIIGEVMPRCEITFGEHGGDTRSYRVNFDKIEGALGFKCRYTAKDGAAQLNALFDRIGFTAADFAAPPFTRLRQLERLLKTGQLDRELRWR